MQARVGWQVVIPLLHNMPIKQSVRPVTPLAKNASVAPVRPAAYRQR
jgi:hypothetical protein